MNWFINFKEKNNFTKKENIFFLLIILIIFLCDRVSKINIINNLNEKAYYINDYINFDLIWNTGIGFGLLSYNSSLIYNLITSLISIVILVLTFFALGSKKNDKIIFSIIIGGALGNLYDRLVYNAVPDFIDLHYNNFHWFTFNVADIFITTGIIAYLINGIFEN
tara:strand:- start:858 stop:1352 length:495 start_codon:yes stop_codon:yes gene_type:complete